MIFIDNKLVESTIRIELADIAIVFRRRKTKEKK